MNDGDLNKFRRLLNSDATTYEEYKKATAELIVLAGFALSELAGYKDMNLLRGLMDLDDAIEEFPIAKKGLEKLRLQLTEKQARLAEIERQEPVEEVLPASDEVCPVCNGIFPIGEFNILAMVHKPCGTLIKEWRDDPEQKCVVCGAPPAAQVVAGQHADDVAVDRFSEAMKAKMAASRAKGRGGWESTEVCPPGSLQRMLLDHLAKGDPVDVGNFAMMIFNRGESTAAQPVADDVVRDAARYRFIRVRGWITHGNAAACDEAIDRHMLAAQQQKGDK